MYLQQALALAQIRQMVDYNAKNTRRIRPHHFYRLQSKIFARTKKWIPG